MGQQTYSQVLPSTLCFCREFGAQNKQLKETPTVTRDRGGGGEGRARLTASQKSKITACCFKITVQAIQVSFVASLVSRMTPVRRCKLPLFVDFALV